jgi:starvation-inducible outer membrane lipoprotein
MEAVMNVLRISSLLATDILLVAMLAFLLAGCVTTPQQNRNGDFVSHMASADVNVPATAPPARTSVRKA